MTAIYTKKKTVETILSSPTNDFNTDGNNFHFPNNVASAMKMVEISVIEYPTHCVSNTIWKIKNVAKVTKTNAIPTSPLRQPNVDFKVSKIF